MRLGAPRSHRPQHGIQDFRPPSVSHLSETCGGSTMPLIYSTEQSSSDGRVWQRITFFNYLHSQSFDPKEKSSREGKSAEAP